MNVSSRDRRNRLMVTTAMAGATLFGLGQGAQAACVPAPAPDYVCSGANTSGQIVPAGISLPLDASGLIALLLAPPNPSVTTDPGFSVTTSDPFALAILGSGAVSYNDANSSALTSTTGIGLGVVSLVPQIAPPYYGPNLGGSVAIDTGGAISGALIGLAAVNTGNDVTTVKATGDIKATGGYGAIVYSQGDDSTVETGKVTGTKGGILALNQGATADLKVTANGDVDGGAGIGIDARNGGQQLDVLDTLQNRAPTFSGPILNNGKDLTVMANGKVSGGFFGIVAENFGTGATNVAATGTVTGTTLNGINVTNHTTATGLTVEAAAVSGGLSGIVAENLGTGATNVAATGTATGTIFFGIDVSNGATATSLTVEAAAASGGFSGIVAENLGTGTTKVAATGTVTGTLFDGIKVSNGATATGLTVEAAAVSGGQHGIVALNEGTGATSVTATGTVTATGYDGIKVSNGASGTDLTVKAAAVSGGTYGIYAENKGTGTINITATGAVQGSFAAISATSNAGHAIAITTDSLVHNSSGLTTDLAIETAGGPVNFTNKGSLLGTVKLGAFATNLVANKATWNTAGGTNEFGGGKLTNDAGKDIVTASVGSAVPVTTTFNALATFTNNGRLTMANNVAGDVTKQIGGNATFAPGAVLAVDIGGAGIADLFHTTGTATITGSNLVVTARDLATGHFVVLTADGGLGGTQFASITGVTNTAFLAVTNGYDTNNAYLDVTKVRDFADAGLTPNQIAIGRGLDSIPESGPLFTAVAGLATDAEARYAYDQLSGEIHASAKGMLVEDSRFVRDAAASRIRAAFGDGSTAALPIMAYGDGGPEMVAADTDRFAVWGQAFGSWGNTDSDGNAAAFDRSTGGLLAGADTLVGGWRVGVLGGYSHSSFNADDRNSSGKSDNYHLGLYGGTNWGAVAFRTGAAYSWHDISTNRAVVFNNFDEALSAGYSAGAAQIFGELAYRADAGQFKVEPFANLAYVSVHTDGFTETGGAAALTSAGTTTDATFTTLGLRASTDFALGGMNATARGTLGWRHAYGDVTPASTFAFASGDALTIAGVPIARDAAIVEAGLDFNMSANAKLGLSYSGQFGGSSVDHGAKANLSVKF